MNSMGSCCSVLIFLMVKGSYGN
uniref:Uncharacterized protein n=1 Tax=Anguilla anguilla TaxID=7936 RepID=A0A0E9TMK8_ANGAN